MVLCDTNIWLALALSGHRHHVVARDWLDSVSDQTSIWFCRSTQQSLLRLLSTTQVLSAYGRPPLTNSEAWQVYQTFTSDDRISLRISEPTGLDSLWQQISAGNRASPKLWMDAYLAAFAIAADCELVTIDQGYQQFDGLKLRLLAS
ncbi:MAG: PIN domain-containing protein [Candidatus Eremiobacteraeota bacterium]|nr:PIN domain-containing protein [Candidatus Eremiobacteraeota bacterium]